MLHDTCRITSDQNDYYGRITTRLPTPPVLYPGHVTDLGSSGTPSPKETLKDYFEPYTSDLHLPHCNRDSSVSKFWRDEPLFNNNDFEHLVGNVLDDEDKLAFSSSPTLHRSISTLLSITATSLATMSPEHVGHHLQNAIGVIHQLVDTLKATQTDLDKKCHQVWSLQSCLTAKDLEVRNIKQQLAVANRLYDAQTIKLQQMTEKKTMVSEQLPKANSRRRPSEKPCQSRQQQGILSAEYRRHLDKNAQVDWEAMVDKIIQRGDQQASLFLQQKLKCVTEEQKQAIFEAILPQAYPLMTSRFGNFLVQRLLEVGTIDQVTALIGTMQGRVVALTCQQFGCHVLQKAFDCCSDEQMKADLVCELFQNIQDTITHKHACHIWQKVFEMQWTIPNPPAVMDHVNKAIQGKWTQVALDETGSLVIQHIFENLKEDASKRPVIEEVLTNVVTIAKGQWGNWVIQHVLEQAQENRDRERAFEAVLEHAATLSMDQFASKVVEKALRAGGPVFLERFMDKVLTSGQRRREPLIDMASDQYGNYVVQWLINHTETNDQVKMCRLIKRHMVSLRGSKYGQRVAFLVEKVLRSHEITTYPAQH
ncbi:hypothetical protein LRAMOSA08920 [Lichtheimia ramosa]|uniref:PUM-HD domain-containing protein n=1 Tax=Lichtheimia ramosa TaxID=688394 RepID=A0A077WID2_9FUNG|nr:hypothetical protein LRAMOSA08920 [Lichtheimia ramosa]